MGRCSGLNICVYIILFLLSSIIYFFFFFGLC